MTRASEASLAGLKLIRDLVQECKDEVESGAYMRDRIPGARKTLADRNAERLLRLAAIVDALASTCVENFEGEIDAPETPRSG